MQRKPRRRREGEQGQGTTPTPTPGTTSDPAPEVTPAAVAILNRLASPLPALTMDRDRGFALVRPERVAFATTVGTAGGNIKVIDDQNHEWLRYDESLNSLEALLKPDVRFKRIHNQYIANLYLIREVIRLSSGAKVLFYGLPDDQVAIVSDGSWVEFKAAVGI